MKSFIVAALATLAVVVSAAPAQDDVALLPEAAPEAEVENQREKKSYYGAYQMSNFGPIMEGYGGRFYRGADVQLQAMAAENANQAMEVAPPQARSSYGGVPVALAGGYGAGAYGGPSAYGAGAYGQSLYGAGAYGGLAGPHLGSPALGVFPNANVGNCAVPLLLSCSPSLVSGHLVRQQYAKPSYGGSLYRESEEPTKPKEVEDGQHTEAKNVHHAETVDKAHTAADSSKSHISGAKQQLVHFQ